MYYFFQTLKLIYEQLVPLRKRKQNPNDWAALRILDAADWMDAVLKEGVRLLHSIKWTNIEPARGEQAWRDVMTGQLSVTCWMAAGGVGAM